MPAAVRTEGALIPSLPVSLARRRLLFASGLALALSASAAARFEIAGLSFQPVLIPVAALAATVGGRAFGRIPRSIRFTLLAFVGLYCLSSLVGGPSVVPLFKILALPFVVIVVGGSIEDDDDGRAAALGFSLAMGLVSLWALAFGESTVRGVNPFSGTTNDNGFSVYALPALLVAGYYVLERTTPFRSRMMFAACSAVIVIAIFTTPNRSGYLGVVVVVVLLLARGRRMRDVIILVALGSMLYVGFNTFGDTTALDYEFSERKDRQSDMDRRRELFDTAVDVGLANPALGVGIQNVPTEIGTRLYAIGRTDYPLIDAHNVLGDVVAGGGLLLSLSFVGLGWCLWVRPSEWRAIGPPSPGEKDTRGLLRIMVVLFLVRGLFTGAVLTTPGFMLGIGIALGLMVANRPRAEVPEASPLAGTETRRRAGRHGAVPPPRPRSVAASHAMSRFDHPRRLVAFDPWEQRSIEPGRP
jgi:hypothetical protein